MYSFSVSVLYKLLFNQGRSQTFDRREAGGKEGTIEILNFKKFAKRFSKDFQKNLRKF